METKNFSRDFMAQALENAAWKELSRTFAWTEALLVRYQTKLDWEKVSSNANIVWTAAMVERFKNKIDWNSFSALCNEWLFSPEMLERYKEWWNWHELSRNTSLKLTDALLVQFADYWDWSEIIDCYGHDNLFDATFLERYADYIPVDVLTHSCLWNEMVEDTTRRLKMQMLA